MTGIERWRTPTALVPGVSHVVALRSQEQVGRVPARGIVAMVKDVPTCGNRSDEQSPRDTVSQPRASLPSDSSVSVWVAGTGPFVAPRFGYYKAGQEHAAHFRRVVAAQTHRLSGSRVAVALQAFVVRATQSVDTNFNGTRAVAYQAHAGDYTVRTRGI